ncbi:hypothetical protein GUJ93_ZPchr0004g40446 [Zizania palustris]|uniref:Uncharacterized protein n=1 Tax=Zizania palustris TaxID=103762 RepID=A0A8J5SME6_ZIZPA|nr:hypothetical protein GUJ93_ZPchr0004g40446 [Zizania palustris]
MAILSQLQLRHQMPDRLRLKKLSTDLRRCKIRSTELSSTLKCWLEERNLSSEESQLIRLREGYVSEGMRLSVIGILSKKGDLMILPPPEPVSTGCVLLSFLLPTYFDGIVLRLVDRSYLMPNSGVS